MDIKQMQYLITLADAGSYTLAARELSVSQPSLSSLVNKVEGEMGLRLFERNVTPITLTYAGKIYIDSLRRICDKAETLERQMNDISGRNRGTIKVGFSTEIATHVTPRALPIFKEKYPDVEIIMMAGQSCKMLRFVNDGRLDMAIVPTENISERLVGNELYEEELVLADGCGFITEDMLIAGTKHRVDPAKLDGIPLITTDSGHGIRMSQDRLFARHEVTPDIIMEVPSSMSAYMLASAGMGVAIVPRMVTDMTKPAGEVKIYHITFTGYRWVVSALTRRNAYITDMDRAFINCMRSVMNDLRYGEI